jgi:hypothetical protein
MLPSKSSPPENVVPTAFALRAALTNHYRDALQWWNDLKAKHGREDAPEVVDALDHVRELDGQLTAHQKSTATNLALHR